MNKFNKILKKLNPVTAIKNYKKLPQEIKDRDAIRLASWGIPIALIPSFRYMQDKDKKPSLRKELFIRDFSTYSVGIGVFLGSAALVRKGLTKAAKKPLETAVKSKIFIATEVIASTLYCAWAGLLAPKLSQRANKEGAGLIGEENIKKQPLKQNVNFTRNYKPSVASLKLYSGFRI